MERTAMYTPLGDTALGNGVHVHASWWEVRVYELAFCPTIDLAILIGNHVNNTTLIIEKQRVIVAIAAPTEESWERFEAKLAKYEQNVLNALEVRKWASFAI